jgi:hypothetical protein
VIVKCIIRIEQDSEYKPAIPMLSEMDLEVAGPNCVRLHDYVMEHSKDKLAFPAKVDQEYQIVKHCIQWRV